MLFACSCAPRIDHETYRFVVCPGSRFLGNLTELTRAASLLVIPASVPPTVAIFDTDAPVSDVAAYYLTEYHYAVELQTSTGAPAYMRSGELLVDLRNAVPLLARLGVPVDMQKAVGRYVAVEIFPRADRPRVTLQRPYFDVLHSRVVDRTMILMSR
jgi:hypothetical protein